jgi:hypothetical protein
VPTGKIIGKVLGLARSILVKNFLRPFDMHALKQTLYDVVAWKVLDPHMSPSEQTRMWRVVSKAGGTIGT